MIIKTGRIQRAFRKLVSLHVFLMSCAMLMTGLTVPSYAASLTANAPNTASNALPMYRLYNPNSGEHFWTSSRVEFQEIIKAGWYDEGTGWYAPSHSNTPVYRLYNPNAPLGDHHYTMSKHEYDTLIKLGWRGEGIGWYSDDNEGAPLYRLYCPGTYAAGASGAHHYTVNKNERNCLIHVGWKDENIAWYGLSSSMIKTIQRYEREQNNQNNNSTNTGTGTNTGTNTTNGTGTGTGTGTNIDDKPDDSVNANQQKILHACFSTDSPGSGLAAMWVGQVYNNAGFGYPTGNANDMYYTYCHSNNKNELKVGMLIAVPTHNRTASGSVYGHVGIYIGHGQVMENIGRINIQKLDEWIAYYGEKAEVRWGFAANGIA